MIQEREALRKAFTRALRLPAEWGISLQAIINQHIYKCIIKVKQMSDESSSLKSTGDKQKYIEYNNNKSLYIY